LLNDGFPVKFESMTLRILISSILLGFISLIDCFAQPAPPPPPQGGLPLDSVMWLLLVASVIYGLIRIVRFKRQEA
jgi:hypothetical protein